MPVLENNGARLYYETTGSGEPMVLVHGSWDDHHVWDQVVPALAESFRVLTYDRRGHSASTAPTGQGSVQDDLADLAALIKEAGEPAHVVANSFGAVISIALAARQPELFRSLAGHEPPLFGLLAADPETRPMAEEFRRRVEPVVRFIADGQGEEAARVFVEDVAVGPGAWEMLPEPGRELMARNAPTFMDELGDPGAFNLDLAGLKHFDKPALFTGGDQSPPFFGVILSKLKGILPSAQFRTIAGFGHVPHETHPREYVEMIRQFARP